MYSFSYLEPIDCSMSGSNYWFLTCIQISQEASKVVWYSYLQFQFPSSNCGRIFRSLLWSHNKGLLWSHTVKGYLVMSMCRVMSCVVGRGYLLWPVNFLGKTLLVFALFHFVLQGQNCLLLQVFLDFLLLHSSPLWRKGHLFWVLVLEGLVGLPRTIQLQLLQR